MSNTDIFLGPPNDIENIITHFAHSNNSKSLYIIKHKESKSYLPTTLLKNKNTFLILTSYIKINLYELYSEILNRDDIQYLKNNVYIASDSEIVMPEYRIYFYELQYALFDPRMYDSILKVINVKDPKDTLDSLLTIFKRLMLLLGNFCLDYCHIFNIINTSKENTHVLTDDLFHVNPFYVNNVYTTLSLDEPIIDIPFIRKQIKQIDYPEKIKLCVINLNKLTKLNKIKICANYIVNEIYIDTYSDDDCAYPNYIEIDGWDDDISNITTFNDLPSNAQLYLNYLKNKLNCDIALINTSDNNYINCQ
jgi:hypothetical protein